MKIIIIGAGVAGLGIGWRLAQNGAEVVILERAQPASAATWAAAGMIAPSAELGDAPGPEAEFGRAAAALWPEFAKEVEAEGGVPVSYNESGALLAAHDAGGLAALARLGGEMLDAEQARLRAPMLAPDIAGALWSAREAHVDNRALGEGLAAAFRRAGGTLAANEAVVQIERHEGRIALRTPFRLHHADAFVLAAGAWSSALADDLLPETLPRVVPVKGQMIALSPPPGGVFPAPVVWGWSEGVYLVPRGGRMLIGATVEEAGFDTSLTRTGRDWLYGRAVRLMPGLADWNPADHWAGLRPKSEDGLPLLGPTRTPGLFLASGQYRNGILYAPAVADLMCDVVLGRRDALAAFDPRRFA